MYRAQFYRKSGIILLYFFFNTASWFVNVTTGYGKLIPIVETGISLPL